MNGQKYEKITLIVYAQYDERHDKELFFDVYQDTEKTYCSQRIMPPFPGMAPTDGLRHKKTGRPAEQGTDNSGTEIHFRLPAEPRPAEAGTGTKNGRNREQISVEPEYILLDLKRINKILMKGMQTTENKPNKCKSAHICKFRCRRLHLVVISDKPRLLLYDSDNISVKNRCFLPFSDVISNYICNFVSKI